MLFHQIAVVSWHKLLGPQLKPLMSAATSGAAAIQLTDLQMQPTDSIHCNFPPIEIMPTSANNTMQLSLSPEMWAAYQKAPRKICINVKDVYNVIFSSSAYIFMSSWWILITGVTSSSGVILDEQPPVKLIKHYFTWAVACISRN